MGLWKHSLCYKDVPSALLHLVLVSSPPRCPLYLSVISILVSSLSWCHLFLGVISILVSSPKSSLSCCYLQSHLYLCVISRVISILVSSLSWCHLLRTMPDIQLTYFDLRARAEPARLLLAYGGVTYEDERIATPWDDRAGWLAKKSSFAWGQVPRLTWDGKIIYTALAIARFLAREFGLMGKNNLESGQVDEVVDVIQDTLQAGYKTFWMPDEEKKKALEK